MLLDHAQRCTTKAISEYGGVLMLLGLVYEPTAYYAGYISHTVEDWYGTRRSSKPVAWVLRASIQES